jgi:hypothetical protein
MGSVGGLVSVDAGAAITAVDLWSSMAPHVSRRPGLRAFKIAPPVSGRTGWLSSGAPCAPARR